MALVVNDMDTTFNIVVEHEEEKLEFTFRQLTYKEKNKIASLTTTLKQGRTVVDISLNCFYVIKYGLISVDGIKLPSGMPWQLEKVTEDNFLCDSDNSVDALLNSQVSNSLIYAANAMLSGIPTKIVNPMNGIEVAGVSVIINEIESKKKS